MVVHAAILALRKLRQKDFVIKGSLVLITYIVKSCLLKKGGGGWKRG
jgi:hypothetical protein